MLYLIFTQNLNFNRLENKFIMINEFQIFLTTVKILYD